MFNNIIKILRINNYVKNLVVFVPLIFSLQIFNYDLFLLSVKMFIAFCLSSSTVYIFNDIIDIDSDRLHPMKRMRPIANGDISLKSSWCILIILLCASIFISKFSILGLSMILSYLILNILYTFCYNFSYSSIFN